MNKNSSKATDALLALMVESLGIVIIVVIAGISDKIANLMLIFIVGLWLLFLVEHYQTVGDFATKLANIEGGAKKA